jgi:hypothetical protein
VKTAVTLGSWSPRPDRADPGTAVIDAMTVDDLATWGEFCGWALARGHARSGEAAVIAGYLGADDAFDHAMTTFAEAYADHNGGPRRPAGRHQERPDHGPPSSLIDHRGGEAI